MAPGEDGIPGVLYIDLHLLHEVTSPHGFSELESADLEVRCPHARWPPWTTRPRLTAESPSQRAAGARRCGSRPAGTAGTQLRGPRDPALRSGKRSTGHRSRHGARVGVHSARNDGRLRRQPHQHPWGLWHPGLRHRLERGRSRAGNAEPATAEAEDPRGERRGIVARRQ